MKYDNEDLAILCERFDLFEYVKNKYELKRISNDSWAMQCPNHVDNTPSLVISPSRNKFHCFSCEAGASPIDFMTKIEKMKFPDAIQFISNETGYEIVQKKISTALEFYKSAKKCHEKSTKTVTNREILDWSYYEQFSNELPSEWLNENMSEEVLREYDIRIDKKSNRIVYPVFDNNDNLIGCKGRSRFSNFKELGIAKYMNYKKIDATDFLIGSKYNRKQILADNSVVIFEGIKSGLKLTTYTGKKNWLAAETSYLNDDQIRVLLSMGIKDITIAFDSDVCFDKIKKCTEKLRRFTNVYYIKNDGSLGEKESPIDRGIEVFNKLYEKRVHI